MLGGRVYPLQKKQNSTYEKCGATIAKFFFACEKTFLLCCRFGMLFHMLKLGFSASDLGVFFGGPGLRVYNTFIVLNRACANLCVSPQAIEKFAKKICMLQI